MNRLVALLLAALLPSTGCSFALMIPAPAPVPIPDAPLECSQTVVPPVLDTVLLGATAAGVVGLAKESCEFSGRSRSCEQRRNLLLGAGVGLLALLTASAWDGFKEGSRCAALQQQSALCIRGSDAACAVLNPDWERPPLAAPPGLRPEPPPAFQTTPAPGPALAPAGDPR
jgi:hypothetical protein